MDSCACDNCPGQETGSSVKKENGPTLPTKPKDSFNPLDLLDITNQDSDDETVGTSALENISNLFVNTN